MYGVPSYITQRISKDIWRPNGGMYYTLIILSTPSPVKYGNICKFTSFLQELVQLRNLPAAETEATDRIRLTTAGSELDTCVRCSGTDIGSYIVRNDQPTSRDICEQT